MPHIFSPAPTQKQLEENILKSVAEIETFKADLLKDPFRWTNEIDRRIDEAEQKVGKELTPLEIAHAIQIPEWAPIINWIEAYIQHDLRLPKLDRRIQKQLRELLRFSKKVRRQGYVYADILALSALYAINQDDVHHEEMLDRIPTMSLKLHPQQAPAKPNVIRLQKESAQQSDHSVHTSLTPTTTFSENVEKYIFRDLDALGFPYQILIPFPTDLSDLEITQLWSAGLHPLGQVPRWVPEESFSTKPHGWWMHDKGHSDLAFAIQIGVDRRAINKMSIDDRRTAVREKLPTISRKEFRHSQRQGGLKLWNFLNQSQQNLSPEKFNKLAYTAYNDFHEFLNITLTEIDKWIKAQEN